jgi:hypothetical protein
MRYRWRYNIKIDLKNKLRGCGLGLCGSVLGPVVRSWKRQSTFGVHNLAISVYFGRLFYKYGCEFNLTKQIILNGHKLK